MCLCYALMKDILLLLLLTVLYYTYFKTPQVFICFFLFLSLSFFLCLTFFSIHLRRSHTNNEHSFRPNEGIFLSCVFSLLEVYSVFFFLVCSSMLFIMLLVLVKHYIFFFIISFVSCHGCVAVMNVQFIYICCYKGIHYNRRT